VIFYKNKLSKIKVRKYLKIVKKRFLQTKTNTFLERFAKIFLSPKTMIKYRFKDSSQFESDFWSTYLNFKISSVK